MPTYIITCKAEASDAEFQAVKDHAKEQGGEIGHEYSLIKGFSVTFPEGAIQSLDSNPHVESIEEDSVVTTQ
ncbi:hypothetical protein N7471_007576 [Penicillium samsonianum]|uniref:uncharacterized protein n=1 Tax=Penicillium samsonianum TaxID=1882272 RepID=UPI002546CDE7|nr:uncharacterized protein N7471_007576 [Penicillium samsonianum]KAJ6132361.1 hypothetical protein N7471_007576 [Penicillium samsonianum]